MSKLPYEMDAATFTSTFGHIYERTPSIPETAHTSLKPYHDTPKSLHTLFSTIFNNLSHQEKHRILNAHPPLAVPADNASNITPQSLSEQTSRGLLSLPTDLRTFFQAHNEEYEKKFGWPFIIPVKDFSIDQIVEQMVSRLRNEPCEEFTIACACVDRIAQIRVEKWFTDNHPNTTATNVTQTESS